MRLKELREESNLTQRDVANAIHIGTSSVGRWERGEGLPTVDFIIRLADFFQVSVDYLLGRSDDFGYVNLQFPAHALSAQEQKFLKNFRKLDPRQQSIIIGIVELLSAIKK